MRGKKLICYEDIHYVLNWKYKSYLKDDFEIIKVSDIEKEINYCSGSTQYIMRYIELLKDRVIRFLSNLNDVKIAIGVFDQNNILHRVMVGAYYVICNILKRDVKKTSFYKSIFTIIEYQGNIVFMGDLSFDGIDI
jgi:hypothetical protein